MNVYSVHGGPSLEPSRGGLSGLCVTARASWRAQKAAGGVTECGSLKLRCEGAGKVPGLVRRGTLSAFMVGAHRLP